jgi:predicted metalloprotease
MTDLSHDPRASPPTTEPATEPATVVADRRRRRTLAVMAIVLVAVAVVAGFAWLRSGGFQGDGLGRLRTLPILSRLAAAPAADGGSAVENAAITDELQFLQFVVSDIQTTWQDLFTKAGMQYVPTQLVVFRDTTRSACGSASAETGPFYCPVDQRVYLDLGFFDEMTTKLNAPGDFADAYVVAHEFGHHVQDLLGITGQVSEIEQGDPSIANALSVRTELQADCLAGIWGHSTYEQSRLEPGDLDEAVNAAAAVGDDRLQRQATGTVDPDTFTHGTSEQRVAWFLAGFRSGDPAVCDSFQEALPSVAGAGPATSG